MPLSRVIGIPGPSMGPSAAKLLGVSIHGVGRNAEQQQGVRSVRGQLARDGSRNARGGAAATARSDVAGPAGRDRGEVPSRWGRC